MSFGIKHESPTLVEWLDRPAGKDPGHLSHIILAIAAIDTERVQLHQFAAIVFIESPRSGLRRLPRLHTGGLRVRPNAEPVVEVEEHRRTLGHRPQQVAELSQRISTDYIALIAGDEVLVLVFVQKHIEVVEPEVGHHLFKLMLAVDGPQDFCLLQFRRDNPGGIVHGVIGLALNRREIRGQPADQIARAILRQGAAIAHGHLHQGRHSLGFWQREQHVGDIPGRFPVGLLRGFGCLVCGFLRGIV